MNPLTSRTESGTGAVASGGGLQLASRQINQDVGPTFMPGNGSLLLVEPDDNRRRCLAEVLAPAAGAIAAVRSRNEALRALTTGQVAVIVTAAWLPDGQWPDFVSDTAEMPTRPNIIVEAHEAGWPSKAEVLALGGFGVLPENSQEAEAKLLVRFAVQEWSRRVNRAAARTEIAGTYQDVPGIPHVLVVDDERMIRDLMVRILEPQGISARTAEDGEEAIELARWDSAISLAILDWHLPGITGELVYDELAALRPGIKAIVASGDLPLEVEYAFAGRKVDAFLPKPFKIEPFVKAVKSALAR
jgi:DNA-binding NtrC family response regulator